MVLSSAWPAARSPALCLSCTRNAAVRASSTPRRPLRAQQLLRVIDLHAPRKIKNDVINRNQMSDSMHDSGALAVVLQEQGSGGDGCWRLGFRGAAVGTSSRSLVVVC
jgi:hypothetical protein